MELIDKPKEKSIIENGNSSQHSVRQLLSQWLKKLSTTNHGKVFLLLFLAKLAVVLLFMPLLTETWWIPFIKNWVSQGLVNPWNAFLTQFEGYTFAYKAFPYGPGMVFVLSIPFWIQSLFISMDPTVVTFLDKCLLFVPIIAADLGIFYFLLSAFQLRARRATYIYWSSPIVFFITYCHGQLDILPMFWMMFSLNLLFRNQLKLSAILYAISLVTKENVLVALPLFFIFIWKQDNQWFKPKAWGWLFLVILTYILFISPFFNSFGYRQMVLNTEERGWIFSNTLSLFGSEILIIPLLVGGIYFKFFLYNKVNKDIFLAYVGLVFTTLLLLIPTNAPGWYMWMMPFFCYYCIQTPRPTKSILVVFSILFILYFQVQVPYPLQLIRPDLKEGTAEYLTHYLSLSQIKIMKDLIFTFLMGITGYIALIMYINGVRSNEIYKERNGPILIGVGGDSGAGKDTLCELIKKLLGHHRVIQADGDDHHKWERNHQMWKSYTHLNPKANDLFLQFSQARSLQQGATVLRKFYDHQTGQFTNQQLVESNQYVLISGLHPFYIKSMRHMIDVKIYLDPEEKLINFWKIKRDMMDRKHSKEQVLASIHARKTDSQKYIEPQKKYADLIIRYGFLNDHDVDIDSFDPYQNNISPSLKVGLIVDNSINLEDLVYELKQSSGVNLTHQYKDEHVQMLDIDGTISKETIRELADHMIPNLYELTSHKIQFEDNLNGIVQFVILSILSFKKINI